MRRDDVQFSRVKALAGLTLSFAFVLLTGGVPAWAQLPAPEPQTLLLHPGGVVNVQDLPRVGPRAPVHLERPIRFPDLDLLRQTKAQHALSRVQPAPAVTAQGTPSGVTATTPGLIGLRFSESGGYVPPDTQLGVGPNHIVEAVNLEIRFWTKTGDLLRSSDLNTFFGLPSSVLLSDPKIRFDPQSNRWFIAVISFNNSFTAGAWRLAASTTSDPTASFVIYTVSTSKSAPDFPALGLNEDKVVLTANAFRANSFLGTEFLVIKKADLVSGVSAAATFFPPNQGSFTIQPAYSLSSTCNAASVCTLYLAAVAFNSATSIRVWAVQGVPGVGAGVTFTTASFPIGALTSPPDAQQFGTTVLIQTNDNRLLDAVFRNGVLWVSANSACKPSPDTQTRACLRLIQLSTTGGLATLQDFDFGASGTYFYYPAIQLDSTGNLISVFSGSSALQYAGVFASGQRTTDGANTFQTPVLIKAGENSYTPFANRWGDYSGAAIDPSTQATVWVAGEYARIEGGSEWGTWLAPVQMGP